MDRLRSPTLTAWRASTARKPLVLRGARQVGKSHLVRTFGTEHFATLAEINLERRPEFAACFADNDPRATLRRLEVLLGRRIPTDGSALLFLDEIQAAPGVLARLRWFAEELPELPVIAAGSLLDFALREPDVSVPVGRITFLYLEPMGFEEFCLALGDGPLVDWLRTGVTAASLRRIEPAERPQHQLALRRFRQWLIVGGMPAVVEQYRREQSILEVASLQRDLMATLRDDFAKYAGRVPHARLTKVLASVAQQLGSKFVYGRVDREERAAALRQAVELLCHARVCHKVLRSSAQGLPLAAGSDEQVFKLLHLDVGLACSALGLEVSALDEARELTLVNRGAIAEQAVGQLLRLTFAPNEDPALCWWRRERVGSEAELDYVIAVAGRVVPIEVKAGVSGRLRSLHGFMADRGMDLALRVNSAPPCVEDLQADTPHGRSRFRLLSLPAYLVEQAPRLLRALT